MAAVGPATEAALRDWGIAPDLVPEVATTAALGHAFPPGPGSVLLARADLANPELAVLLRAKAWQTTEVVAYHTVPVGTLDPAARRRLDSGEVDWVAFTASSTVEGFLRGYGGPPPPGCPGRRHRPGHRRHRPLRRHPGRRHRDRAHHRRPGRRHRARRHRLTPPGGVVG